MTTVVFNVAATTLFALCLFPIPSVADEFFPFCDPESGFLNHQFSPQHLEDISRATQSFEQSPFSTACHEPEALRDRPKTGLFHRSIPNTDKFGNSSKELLNLVGETALSDLEGEDGFLKAVEDCISNPNRADVCPPAIRTTIGEWKSAFLKTIAGARIDLALSQDAKDYGTILSHSSAKSLNTELDSRGTQKEKSWKPLSPSERETASGILEDYIAEAKAKAAESHKVGSSEYKKFVNDAVLGARLKNGYNYVNTLSRMPLLQFVNSEKPSDQEILDGIKIMRKHIAEDIKATKENLKIANQNVSIIYGRSGVEVRRVPRTEIDPRALSLLDFSPQLEAILRENPKFCGLATSLVNTKDNRKIGNSLALGIPLAVTAIVVPFFTPWIIGAGVGAAAGSVAVVESKLSRDEAAHRFMTVVEYENVHQDRPTEPYQRLAEADKEFKVSLILPPAGAILGGVGKTVEVTRAALNIGARMSVNLAEKSSVAIKEISAAGKRLERGIAEIKNAAKERAKRGRTP